VFESETVGVERMRKRRVVPLLIAVLGIALAVIGLLYGAFNEMSPWVLAAPGLGIAVLAVASLVGHQT
jgi:drug/metabolite transporter (DMT)-like permease